MNKLWRFFQVVIMAALAVLLLDKAAGRILYFLDPAFRRYVDAKSNKERASAGENVNVIKYGLNGHQERIVVQ